jgi:hypothetical protein
VCENLPPPGSEEREQLRRGLTLSEGLARLKGDEENHNNDDMVISA